MMLPSITRHANGGHVDLDDVSVRASSLLRRAGLRDVPRSVIVGTIFIGLALMLVGIWQFWPRTNADYIATANQEQKVSDANAQQIAPTQAEIMIDVEGAVNAPGLYMLAADSRVGEAIEAAGGFAADAQPGATNLAQKLSDGEQVFVPTVEETQGATNAAAKAAMPSSKQDGKININTASAEELQELSGVGPALSGRIIDYRESKGRFSSIEDLKEVSGIGETRFENLKDKICV